MKNAPTQSDTRPANAPDGYHWAQSRNPVLSVGSWSFVVTKPLPARRRNAKPIDHAANAQHAAAHNERQRQQAHQAARRRAEREAPGLVTITRIDGTVEVQAPYTAAELRRLAPERLPIPAELRQRILARDGHACRYCGAGAPFEIDHVIPVAHGGTTTFGNLVTACIPCNRRKGTERWVPQSASRAGLHRACAVSWAARNYGRRQR